MSSALHLVCPHCGAINRVPATRLTEQPKCGSCHALLFTNAPVELQEAQFRRHLAHSELPLLVDFWAPWCGPCHMMAPQFVAAARELEPQVRLAKVDTDQAQTVATQLGIRSIPTLVLFEHGRERARQSGALGAGDIVRWTRSHLSQLPPAG